MKRDDENGIDERSFGFFRDVLAFVETIPVGPKTNKIIEQLTGALYLDKREDIDHYAFTMEKLAVEALRPEETLTRLATLRRSAYPG